VKDSVELVNRSLYVKNTSIHAAVLIQ